MSRRPTPPTPSVTRAAIYTRKSVAAGLEQEFNSLDAQRESCAAYIERQGWTLVDTYEDGGFTGANIDRPGFQRLLADVDAGKIDVIAVYKVDRLSRSLLDFVRVMERLNTAGASFVSVTQNFSTADAMGRLTLNMLMSFAEFEREMIADRTRDKVAAARRKGKWTGGSVPLGYESKDKHLVVNEAEAVVVREVFDLFLAHHQMALVARLLNERRLLPRGSQLAAGKPVRWTKDAVARVLRRPLYAGLTTCGDERHPGEHPAIVDPHVFAEVQRLLTPAETKRMSHGLNPAYLLRGLLKCRCGAAMTPASTRKGPTEYRYYACVTRSKQGNEVCSAPLLPADAIEQFVVDRIGSAVANTHLTDELTTALDGRLRCRRDDLTKLKVALPGQASVANASASRLAEALPNVTGKAREILKSKIEAEAAKAADAERRFAQVDRELAELNGLAADAAWVADTLRDFARVWHVLTIPNRGRLLRAVIDHVTVDEASGRADVHLVDFTTNHTAEAA